MPVPIRNEVCRRWNNLYVLQYCIRGPKYLAVAWQNVGCKLTPLLVPQFGDNASFRLYSFEDITILQLLSGKYLNEAG